jgi:outer membrane protein OmpA-like peptidoglycan-associated protein
MVTLFALSSLLLAAEPVRYELEGNELKLPAPIVFDTGKASLKDESNSVLEYVKGYLEAKPYITLMRVEVHTDSRGDDQANQKLSEARAAAVVAALVKKGVACDRLVAVGFGEHKPIAPNDTPEGAAANRRTSFVNAMLKGRAIGGLPVDGGGVIATMPCKQ